MVTGEAGRWDAALDDFGKESFEADGKRRNVYRIGAGPAVIVISEMPGITPLVAQFGRRVAAAGCTAVLPHLFGDPGRPISAGYAFRSIGSACVSREFACFALKKTSPATVWLRTLAASEHERCGGPGVGVVGMCFTGGFALAMMVDDVVVAPVLSQPSLPFPIGKRHKADIGISDSDLAAGETSGPRRAPACWAFASPTTPSASRTVSRRSAASSVTPSSRWRSTRHRATRTGTRRTPTRSSPTTSIDKEGTPTRAALDQTLSFFREKLGVGTGPGPRPEGMGA